MTPKQMAWLGVFQVQEAILWVLEEEPEGLTLETISTALGISHDFNEETSPHETMAGSDYSMLLGTIACHCNPS